MAKKIAIEEIKTSDLIPYARNSRTHDEAQVAQIAGSIREFGFTNPVLIDGENGIIAGHGRVMAAQKLKLEKVPCIRLKHLTEAQKRAYIIADNKLALNAGWDEELLALELSDLREMDFDLSLTGFDAEAIEAALIPPDLNEDVITGKDQGKTPSDRIEDYENSTIRQIMLIMEKEEFEEIMEILTGIKEKEGYDNNTEAILAAIRAYANDHN